MTQRPPLGPDERRLLLALARHTLERCVVSAPLPEVTACKMPPRLAEPAACFVTLTRGGELRGCIGNFEPRAPLWQAVRENTCAAALRDRRFAPVQPDEVPGLCIEISVLSLLQPLDASDPEERLRRLSPGRDGVLLELGSRRATFLPQVWDKLPDKIAFLDQLARKAGGEAGDWRRPEARLFLYTVEHFAEAENDPPPEGSPPALEAPVSGAYAGGMDLVTVYRTFSAPEAQVIRGRLEAAGLAASVRNEHSALGSGAGIAGVEYCVQVPEAVAEQARQLIQSSGISE